MYGVLESCSYTYIVIVMSAKKEEEKIRQITDMYIADTMMLYSALTMYV